LLQLAPIFNKPGWDCDCGGAAVAQPAAAQYNIIPYPGSLVPGAGQFILSRAMGLEVAGGAFGNERQWFEQLVRGCLGADALTRNHRNRRNVIVLAHYERLDRLKIKYWKG
jgi:hypothetical protein